MKFYFTTHWHFCNTEERNLGETKHKHLNVHGTRHFTYSGKEEEIG